MEDQILLKQISAGDEQAFSILLDKYESRVWRYFCRCFADEHTAADLTQNVFVSILQRLPDQHHRWTFFSRYLFKMCKNIALKEYQRRRVLVTDQTSSETISAPFELPTSELEKQENRSRINTAVASLPFFQQQVILLKYMEDFSLSEIARILAIPVNTVKSHIRRGKQRLRILIEDNNL